MIRLSKRFLAQIDNQMMVDGRSFRSVLLQPTPPKIVNILHRADRGRDGGKLFHKIVSSIVSESQLPYKIVNLLFTITNHTKCPVFFSRPDAMCSQTNASETCKPFERDFQPHGGPRGSLKKSTCPENIHFQAISATDLVTYHADISFPKHS